MRSLLFHKSDDAARWVCFCFAHRVAAVRADARGESGPTLAAAIGARCARGEADCKQKNPSGRCCLGNVSAVVRAAGVVPTREACCDR
jgi:hypothetical protein